MRDNKYLRDKARSRRMSKSRRDRGIPSGEERYYKHSIYDKGPDSYEIYGFGEMRKKEFDDERDRRYYVEDDYDDFGYDRRMYSEDYRGEDYYDYARSGRKSGSRRRDYMHDYGEVEDEYHDDIERWITKLKKKDKFGLSKDQVLQKAKEMNIKLDEVTDDELYAIYLMLSSDYGELMNDPHMILAMTKKFIDDDDIAVSPSEKICIYMYKIVKGE